MEITFDASWVSPRSYGTCYVRLPNLTTFASLPETVLMLRSGAVSLVHPNGETVDTSLSIPPPTDPRGPTWTCKIVDLSNAGSAGFAVLEQPNANRDTQFYLVISGAFIGLGFAMAAEWLVKFTWPLLEHEAPDDD
jgi:hypothetical protein